MYKFAISVIEDASDTNGTTIRARQIVRILEKKYNIVLVTRANTKKGENFLGSIHIETVKPKGTKLWNLKLIPVILKNRFSCVYCVTDLFGFMTYYLFSKLYRYKIFFEAHAVSSKEKEQLSRIKSVLISQFEKFVARHANCIIALSKVAFNFYRRYNQNSFYVPVFIDDGLLKRQNDKIKAKRDGGKKVIGLIGPFDTISNEYQLGFLYSNLDKFDKRINFMIIGKCNKTIRSNRIRYSGYLKSTHDYFRTLSCLDAVIVPVKIATFGPKNKIIEAMACSLPVFTNPKGIIGLDFVKPGQDMLVYEENVLIREVNEKIFNQSLMNKIGGTARRTVEKFYSEKVNKYKILKSLDLILNEDVRSSRSIRMGKITCSIR